MRQRAAIITLLAGTGAVVALWALVTAPGQFPTRVGVGVEARGETGLLDSPISSLDVSQGGHLGADPTARTEVASVPRGLPAPREPTVHDEEAASLPAAALIPLILKETRMLRASGGAAARVPDRASLVAGAKLELARLVADPLWNPSLRPLSESEAAWAGEILVDHEELARSLKRFIEEECDKAWDASVSLGMFLELERTETMAGQSPLERKALDERKSADVEAHFRDLTSQLGIIWQDWTYTSLGGAGRSFEVYCTRQSAPQVFSAAARKKALVSQRQAWLRTFFLSRQLTRPGHLPAR